MTTAHGHLVALESTGALKSLLPAHPLKSIVAPGNTEALEGTGIPEITEALESTGIPEINVALESIEVPEMAVALASTEALAGAPGSEKHQGFGRHCSCPSSFLFAQIPLKVTPELCDTHTRTQGLT
eukprot:1148550-Pelagomonas_calceolata.AAC.3